MRYLLLLLLFTGMFSCRTAEQRAGRKLQRHVEKIKEITYKYPSLVDSVYQIKIDTVRIPEFIKTVELGIVPDSAKVDSLINTIGKLLEEQCQGEEKGKPPAERISPSKRKSLNEQISKIFLNDSANFYSPDSVYKVHVTIKDGKISALFEKKEQKVVIKNKHSVQTFFSRGENNWKNVTFYICLILLLLFLLICTIKGKS